MRLPLLATTLLCATPALAQTSSQAALAQQAALCVPGAAYPAMPPVTPRKVLSATSGTPRIVQVRAGKPIATYTSFAHQPSCNMLRDGTLHTNPGPSAATGCGIWQRVQGFRVWEPGDIFYVYPAVYAGQFNQPWIGPQADGDADYAANPNGHIPTDVKIIGVTVNGVKPVILLDGGTSNNTLGNAPVYLDKSQGLVWDNINVSSAQPTQSPWAGVYDNAASDLTFRNSRISGFEPVNGFQGAKNYHGFLRLENVELDHNGGTGSADNHNAYIGPSLTDPHFKIIVSRLYSHDADYGHLFKTRAQEGDITDSYFQGGLPQPGLAQAEAYDLDIPNGGIYTVTGNVFDKGASGPGSNGISLGWDLEGLVNTAETPNGPPVPRPQSLTATGNTFRAYARTYDGSHPLLPIEMLYPAALPPIAGQAITVSGNTFEGYCPAGVLALDYRGSAATVGVLGQ